MKPQAHLKLEVGVIYCITYPNGKIYIGQDRTDDCNYFGSADSFTIAQDFSREELDTFRVTKRILARRNGITIKDLNALEKMFIQRYESYDPHIGYNRTGAPRRHCKTLLTGTQDESNSAG